MTYFLLAAVILLGLVQPLALQAGAISKFPESPGSGRWRWIETTHAVFDAEAEKHPFFIVLVTVPCELLSATKSLM